MTRGVAAFGACVIAVVLAFAAPATAVPDAHSLTGAGDSWPEKTVRQLQNDAAAAGSLGGLDPVYTAARGEVPAKDDVVAGDVDFAVAQDPLSDDQRAAATAKGVTIASVPLAAGAVGIVLGLQVDQQHGGGLIKNLKLTVPTLAKVFTHRIQYWDDKEIVAENPDVPNLTHLEVKQIVAVVRRDSSATTSALIRAFLADPVAKPIWNTYATGNGSPADTALDAWPDDPVNNTIGVVSGSRGVIDAVLNLDPATGKPVTGTPAHNVGYVAPPFADEFHAPLVALRNRATTGADVLPSADAVTAALSTMATFDATSGRYDLDYAKDTATGSYPIPLVSYLLLPTSGLPAAKAAALRSFIDFALSDPGRTSITATGMVPLTGPAVAAGQAVAAALVATPSASTTSTTTPPPSPAPVATASAMTTTAATGATSHATESPVGAAASSAPASSSPSLPFTGTHALSLVAAGVSAVTIGQVGRRRARR